MEEKVTITLTRNQAQKLGAYLTVYRERRIAEEEASVALSKETYEDGTPKFPKMAYNAVYLHTMNRVLDEIAAILEEAK